ncbi:PREDICTED: ell-associated factor Eaf-like [Rhagoletis zephyria]|uniref:ell-associated factor Eaf-like n=1 Tax=Rhagoletis zephyria TaxID=28612 RepID=UPI0008114CE1|nr:PREDICTED: ell-associated factor Eaf-like [Rhagoletis zephyria]
MAGALYWHPCSSSTYAPAARGNSDDFVPASVDPNKTSIVDFGSNGKVTVTMPNLEGSGTGRESVYQGMRKPHQKECVLIFNPDTGEFVLEKLNTSMIVKKARLRQDDSSGKPLNTVSNNQKPTLSNGSSSSGPSSSQAKSSTHNDKAKSSTLKSTTSGLNMPTVGSATASKLSNKTSPPLPSTSTGLTAPRANGFRQKTPSPPSMPIFSVNKGSLLHTNGTPATSGRSSDSSQDWNGSSGKSKEQQASSVAKLSHKSGAKHSSSNRNLSEDSSSDSDANSDDESDSSSQSSDSSSDDEEMRPVSMSTELSTSKQAVNGGTTNALSMPSILPSISMPTALALPSASLDSTSPNMQLHSSSSNHAKSPISELSRKAPEASALSLSLSEDSDDSSDDEAEMTRPGPTQLNGSDQQQRKTLPKSGSPLESTSKCSPFDSMPKFLNNGSAPSAPSTFPPIPKVTYSQLSQDLQLSESGSDSDDD